MSDSGDEVVPLIVERSLLGALAAMIPIPFVDDALVRRARKVLLREIAARRALGLSAPVLAVLAEDAPASPILAAGVSMFARVARGAMMPVRVLERGRAAVETFQIAVLLDHYARHHHRGLDLDGERAKALRAAFAETASQTPFARSMWRDPARYAEALRISFDACWATSPESA